MKFYQKVYRSFVDNPPDKLEIKAFRYLTFRIQYLRGGDWIDEGSNELRWKNFRYSKK
jgi:hypothetical protein